MAVVIVKEKLTQEDVLKASEDYETYIKITIDIDQEIVAIGGEYHADAEFVLIRHHNSKNTSVWVGGFDIPTKTFETNAMLNFKSATGHTSAYIQDEEIKNKFLEIAKKHLSDIESFL